jgi:hypothetical protein
MHCHIIREMDAEEAKKQHFTQVYYTQTHIPRKLASICVKVRTSASLSCHAAYNVD